MSQAGRTILASDHAPLLHNITTTSITSSRAISDSNLDRLSSKATVRASTAGYQSINAPSTTATAGQKPSQIPITFRPQFRRATTSIITPLEPDFELQHQPLHIMADTSSRHANRNLEVGQRSSPPKPTAWHESVHRDQLVRIWDTVCDVTARNPNYPKCITSQVGSTLNALVKRCPELAQGKVPLTRDWIEYVLGKALRPPFCTAAMMGRWEILASSGGARSMWGPW